MNSPKISCVCVTHKRVNLLKNAIKYFKEQTYSNKELIILYTNEDDETEDFVNTNKVYKNKSLTEYETNAGAEWKTEIINEGTFEIIFIKITPLKNLTLGAKRNLAIKEANGDYICIWDDDDYHAKDRLSKQMSFLTYMEKPAVTLANLTLYHAESNTAYISNLREEGWEGTLLCQKNEIGLYSDLNKHEDAPVLIRLYQDRKLSVMEDPDLYIYNIHTSNTSSNNHFNFLSKLSQQMNENEIETIKSKLLLNNDRSTKIYDGILSLGAWCQVGAAIRVRSLNLISSPFHNFGIKTWQNVIDILDARFDEYWELENMAIGKPEEGYSAKYNDKRLVYKVYCNRYNMLCNHHFDVEDNKPDELLTYSHFKEKIDVLGEVFLKQCEIYERVLFVCKIMSAPEPTVISKNDIIRFCTTLSKIRHGKPYDLRISVPENYYEQVVQWVQEEQLTHVSVFLWIIEFNDEYHAEEWSKMLGDVMIAPDYLHRLNHEIFGITDPESQHINYLNS